MTKRDNPRVIGSRPMMFHHLKAWNRAHIIPWITQVPLPNASS
jgi:hypothetical protein